MKVSVEAKVAAFVAAGFVALTVGVIAQGNNADLSGASNGYVPTNNPGVSTDISQHGYDSSLAGRTDAEETDTALSGSFAPDHRICCPQRDFLSAAYVLR
jgi:hypothetical protein